MNKAVDFADLPLQIQNLKVMALVEGATLVTLVLIAAPLNHLAGVHMATAIVGPIHGMAFLFYFWMLVQANAAGYIPFRFAYRMAIADFIPFGGFVTVRALHRMQTALLRPQ